MTFGGLNTMWIIVLFDLPTDTIQARKHYTRFRKFLLEDGFTMMQYSVYMDTVPVRKIPRSISGESDPAYHRTVKSES